MIRRYWKYLIVIAVLVISGTVYSDFARIIRNAELRLGRGVSEDIRIYAEQGFANAPYLQWDSATQKWQFSNNGSSVEDIGSGTGGGRVGLYHNMLEDSCWDGECDTVSGPWTYVTTQVFHEVSEVAFDSKSLSWTPTGLDTMTSALVAIPEGLYGKACKARLWYKGGDANMDLKVTDGTSTITSVTLAAQANYTAEILSFTCPSSGSLQIEVERTDASLSPEFNFDDAYIGEAFGEGGSGGSGSDPVGTIVAYGGSTAPDGWLIADGSQVSRTTYAALYAVVGDAFGNGDGSTTFHLPDLRGKFVRGHDNTAGNDPDAGSRTACNTGGNTGDNVGSCQADELESHTHSSPYVAGNNTDRSSSQGGGSPGSTGASGGNETRPVNVYATYIIKYEESAGGGGGATDWSTATTNTVTADTTNPTKGTIVKDEILWRQNGQDYEVIIRYEQSAAGNAGNGQYRFQLPAGVQIDTTYHPVTTTLPTTSTDPSWRKSIVGQGHTGTNLASYHAFATAYDANKIKVQTDSVYPIGDDHNGFGAGITTMSLYLRLSFRGVGL